MCLVFSICCGKFFNCAKKIFFSLGVRFFKIVFPSVFCRAVSLASGKRRNMFDVYLFVAKRPCFSTLWLLPVGTKCLGTDFVMYYDFSKFAKTTP